MTRFFFAFENGSGLGYNKMFCPGLDRIGSNFFSSYLQHALMQGNIYLKYEEKTIAKDTDKKTTEKDKKNYLFSFSKY